jgi:hypothetical protein
VLSSPRSIRFNIAADRYCGAHVVTTGATARWRFSPCWATLTNDLCIDFGHVEDRAVSLVLRDPALITAIDLGDITTAEAYGEIHLHTFAPSLSSLQSLVVSSESATALGVFGAFDSLPASLEVLDLSGSSSIIRPGSGAPLATGIQLINLLNTTMTLADKESLIGYLYEYQESWEYSTPTLRINCEGFTQGTLEKIWILENIANQSGSKWVILCDSLIEGEWSISADPLPSGDWDVAAEYPGGNSDWDISDELIGGGDWDIAAEYPGDNADWEILAELIDAADWTISDELIGGGDWDISAATTDGESAWAIESVLIVEE